MPFPIPYTVDESVNTYSFHFLKIQFGNAVNPISHLDDEEKLNDETESANIKFSFHGQTITCNEQLLLYK